MQLFFVVRQVYNRNRFVEAAYPRLSLGDLFIRVAYAFGVSRIRLRKWGKIGPFGFGEARDCLFYFAPRIVLKYGFFPAFLRPPPRKRGPLLNYVADPVA